MKGRTLLLVAGPAALLVALALMVVVPRMVAGDDARLDVVVTGLPAGVDADVEVTGPTTYTVSRVRDDRVVPAGRYTVRIRSVDTPLGRAHPEYDAYPVNVTDRGRTRFTAEYVTIIPATTKVLDAANPGIAGTSGTVVTFTPDSPSLPVLTPGHIFVVGEGPQTPEPMARRIGTVTPTATGVTVTTTPVTISEAMPAGRIRLLDDEEIGFTPARYEPNPALSLNFPAIVGVEEADPGDPGRSCAAQGPLELGMDLKHPGIRTGGSTFDWRIAPPSVSLTLNATMDPDIVLRANVSGKAKCRKRVTGDRGLTWINQLCGRKRGTYARVGPISLRCRVDWAASATLEYNGGFKFTHQMGLLLGVRKNRPVADVHDQRGDPLQQQVFEGVESSVTLGGELGLLVHLEGGDPTGTAWLGLLFDYGVGPDFKIRQVPPPVTAEANITARLTIKVTTDLDLRFDNWPKEYELLELKKSWRLWKSNDNRFRTVVPSPPPPPRPCPPDRTVAAATPWGEGTVLGRTECFGDWVLATVVSNSGIDPHVVLRRDGARVRQFDGSTDDGYHAQCDRPDIREAPPKVTEFLGCRFWRTDVPAGTPAATVLARQRQLTDALRSGDTATVCGLLGHRARGTVELETGTCEAGLPVLRRRLRPTAECLPSADTPLLIQANDEVATVYSVPTPQGICRVLTWYTGGSGPWRVYQL